MMRVALQLLAALGVVGLAPNAACSCEYPEPPSFEAVAPQAKLLFVFRPLVLRLRSVENGGNTAYWIDGDIEVVLSLKGDASPIRHIRYDNFDCGGNRLEPGRYYLVATNSVATTLELAAADQTIGDIGGSDYGPANLAENVYVQRAKAALAGTLPFAAVLDENSHFRVAAGVGLEVKDPPPPRGTARH